jgi:hypothetical protein
MLRIAIIIASTRPGRNGEAVAKKLRNEVDKKINHHPDLVNSILDTDGVSGHEYQDFDM